MNITKEELNILLLVFRRLIYTKDHLTQDDRNAIDIINKLMEDSKDD